MTQRGLVLTALSVIGAWIVLVFVFGGLHFDDFVSIGESRDGFSLSAEQWRRPAADGRWQPLKRATFDVLARTAGMTFWPYALALAAAHLAMVVGTMSAARALWRDGSSGWVAGAIALASLNLSAYSVANVGTLHGIISVALTAWSASSAMHAALEDRRRLRRQMLAALAALAACFYKEIGVTTPALAAFGMWLASRDRQIPRSAMLRAIAAPAAGVALYLAVRMVLDIPLVPPRSRYAPGASWVWAVNALVVLANVVPWGAAAVLGSLTGSRPALRARITGLAVMSVAALAMMLPSLMLSWRSPNFWYGAIPLTALGTAALLRHVPHPRRAYAAVALLMVLTLAGSGAFAWRRGAHKWGPYSEASVAHWMTFPRTGGRVVWFDRDTFAPYGGVARTFGNAERLAFALQLATGDRSIRAETCISLLVGPPCPVNPGDELYMHSAGRLERLPAPPAGRWYVLP